MIRLTRLLPGIVIVVHGACAPRAAGPAASSAPAAAPPGPTAAAAPPGPTAAAGPPAAPSPAAPIPLASAAAAFAQANALCAADHGAIWGVSLCGPMMLADPRTRFAVASQADARHLLRPEAGVFVGTLPPDQTIANTSVTWNGVHWMQVAWPLPVDPGARGVLLMHELFHRVEREIGLAASDHVDNAHLASVDGRTYLQLEWRALARALRASDDTDRRAAVADALAFRRTRRGRAPGSAASEDTLELHEGLAEYTGVVVGQREPAAQIAAALHDLAAHVDDPSFVRSFAYATGPSYGLLLDRYAPGWRQAIARTGSLSDALARALHAPATDAERAAAAYDGPALRAAETARAAAIATRLADLHRLLVDGPVATLALQDMKVQFNPNTVEPLGDLGSVYPTLTMVDSWGVLHVTGSALIKADWSAVVVPAPEDATARPLTGPGWTLELAPGWRLVPDRRRGDVRVARALP